jgi:hypothetical protein
MPRLHIARLRCKALKDLGYDRFYNLGGFWAEAGGVVEKV